MRGLIVFMVLAFAAPMARAEDKAAARAAYEEATKHYYLNELDKALEAYKRAYWNYEDPAFLFNIAQCYRAMGKKEDAVKMYRNYLRRVPTAPNKLEVERLVVTLESEMAQERTTRISPPSGPLPGEIASAPPGPSPRPATPAEASPPPEAKPVETPVAATAGTVTRDAPAKTPVYKKWWLWTVVGVVVVAGVGIGVGVALSQSYGFPSTSPSAGTFRF